MNPPTLRGVHKPATQPSARLVTFPCLSKATGLPVRTLQTLYSAGKLPFLKFGHRTLYFDPVKVMLALAKLETQPKKSRK